MKLIILQICCLVFIANGMSVQAKDIFRAKGLPGFNYDIYNEVFAGEDSDNLILLNGYTQINPHEIVFGERLDVSDTDFRTFKRFYHYDLITQTTKVLLTTPPEEFTGATELWEIFPIGNSIYISVDGKLYIINGARNNATLLRDFGTSTCCYLGATTSSHISDITNVGGIVYFKVYFDIDRSQPFVEVPRQVALWRSDGTTTGTVQLTSGSEFGTGRSTSMPSAVFGNIANDPSSAFFFQNEALFRINDTEVEELFSFDKAADKISGLRFSGETRNRTNLDVGVIQTSNGAFLCVEGPSSADGVSPGYNKLWHFEADGRLTEVADGCRTAFGFGDQLLISRYSGLWLYNTKERTERLIVPGLFALSDTSGCMIDDVVYMTLTDFSTGEQRIPETIYRITQDGKTSNLNSLNRSADDDMEIEACNEEDKSLIIRSGTYRFSNEGSRSFKHFYYNTKTGDQLDVRRIGFQGGGFAIRNTTGTSADSIFIAGTMPYLIELSSIPILPFLDLVLDE